MIKVRFSSFESHERDREIEIIRGETLENAVDRIFEDIPLQKTAIQTVVNGHIVPADLRAFTDLKDSDAVLICPNITSGDSSQTFAQILFTVTVAVAGFYFAPAAGAGPLASIAAGLQTAGVAIIASYIIGQLIPPPIVGNSGGPSDDQTGSQVYSINSQGNGVKKYGIVPKVYGDHRMFPNVAANPYTELEVDPVTGQLAQYLYVIYDFGFGPNLVRDIKIGDTPVENFTDVNFRFVDLNRPVISEGVWDDSLSDHFEYYKGDISSEAFGVVIDGNQNEGDPPSTYQVIRNAADNVEDISQAITVNLVNPQGLFAFNSSGDSTTRTIELKVEFSKIGENIWRGYNDSNYVSDYKATGGDSLTADRTVTLYPAPLDPRNINPTILSHAPYFLLSQTNPVVSSMNAGRVLTERTTYRIGFGFNFDYIIVATSSAVIPGDVIKFNGVDVGLVTSVLPYVTGYVRLTLQQPLKQNIYVYDYVIEKYFQNFDGHTIGEEIITCTNPSVTGKILLKGTSIGILRITANTRQPHYSSVKFTPRQTESYKIRLTRISTASSYVTNVSDTLTFLNINTRQDSAPIATDKRHTFLEMRIRATGQLNGSIQNLSAVVTSVLDTWTGSEWVKAPTSNPAWVFADLLTGQVSKRPVDKSRLDVASLVEWSEYSDEIPDGGMAYEFVEKRHSTNFVLDYTATLQQVLNQVAGAASASLNLIDGRYGVLIDKNRTIPVQIFTPRNSAGFSSARSYTPKPDALKVTFIDPNSNWQANEVIVYDDGFDEVTAVEFQDITTFAITQIEQAWRFGRYFMAQNKLRQETITIKVDFENLVCTRGDFVQITQDVMRVGGTPARVKTITGNRILIDEGLETGPGTYGFVFRARTGEIKTNTLTVVDSDEFDLDGPDLPEPGDLIIIGIVGQLVFDCIVKSIQPQDNLSAVLTLVEKAEEIYTIEQIDEIPGYTPKISGNTDPDFGTPGEVLNLEVIENFYNIKIAGYEYFISLDWDNPLGAATEIFEVYVDFGKGYDLVASTKNSDYTYIVNEDNLGLLHSFKVLAVSATGKKISLGEVTAVTATPLRKTSLPSDVAVFNSDITGEVIQLFWERIADLDAKEYIIRFVPNLTGNWGESTSVLRVSAATSLISTQARVGTYLIKASDFNGNESANAAVIITTIPSLNGLNVISTQNDFPALPGAKDRTVALGSQLTLDFAIAGPPGNEQYYSEGFYYYEDLLDLGDIYSVRLQSLLRAEGLLAADIIANWISLDLVDAMYTVTTSLWDVESQYRGTNVLNVISAWATLSSIGTMSEGSPDIWSAWKKFIIGDATFKIGQFRLRLTSFDPAVTPRVFDGEIRADMPDRIDAFNNISAPDTGYTATYSPAFKGPGTSPNVQVTIENGQSGDYPTFTSKTLAGFTIVFKDKDDNPVARTFDAAVKGWGKKATNSL